MRRETLDRAEFLSWLAGQAGLLGNSPNDPPSVQSSHVTLVWPENDLAAMPLVAVPASEMREFMAFVATYVGTYVPFTAFFRVIPLELIEFIPEFSARIDIDELKPNVGVIIANAIIMAGADRRATDLTLLGCYSTPSYVMSRAIILRFPNMLFDQVAQRWSHVRAVLRIAKDGAEYDQIADLWANAQQCLDWSGINTAKASANPVVQFARKAINSIKMDDYHALSALGISPDILERLVNASREDRVGALNEVGEWLKKSKVNNELKSCVLGYCISAVGEGSFSYANLATKYAEGSAAVVLWFGFFSAFYKGSDVYTIGECLGRRIARKLQEAAYLDRETTSDFGYEEFLLYANEDRIGKIRTERSSAVEIELFPGVIGTFPVQRVTSARGQSDRSTARDDYRSDKLRSLLIEAVSLLSDGRNRESTASGDLFSNTSETRSSKINPRRTLK